MSKPTTAPGAESRDWSTWPLYLLPDTAAEISDRLKAAGLDSVDQVGHTPTLRQAMCLIEEAGELMGAYRRWAGAARRPGRFSDVEAELADAVIVTYVTAADLGLMDAIRGVDLGKKPDRAALSIDEQLRRVPLSSGSRKVAIRASYVQQVAHVMVLLGDAMFNEHNPEDRLKGLLYRIVYCAWVCADVLGVDLRAAIAAKLDVMYRRGWKETTSR